VELLGKQKFLAGQTKNLPCQTKLSFYLPKIVPGKQKKFLLFAQKKTNLEFSLPSSSFVIIRLRAIFFGSESASPQAFSKKIKFPKSAMPSPLR
jgi:hypothetical protein